MNLKTIMLLLCFTPVLLLARQQPVSRDSFKSLNLNTPALHEVNTLVAAGDYDKAAKALLKYYRTRTNIKHPDFNVADQKNYAGKKLSVATMEMADKALLHQFKPHKAYPYFDYGRDINWQYQPVPDMLIRTFLQRTTFWEPLAQAYWSTGDEKYAKEWVVQLRDWIKKNQLNTYPDEKDFAWKAFVVSFRLKNWSQFFNMFINSPNFTPQFLMEFLNSYNEQADYVKANYTDIGNHRLYEALHELYAASNFPEFKNAIAWRKTGLEVLNQEIGKQVLADGMQFELSPSYHIGAIGIFLDALKIAQFNHFENEFPKSYRDLSEKMVMAVVNYSFPDYSFPLYGNAFLTNKEAMLKSYKNWAEVFPHNEVIKYFATDGKSGKKPAYLSNAMPYAGFYAFRNGWDEKSTVMQLKAGPPAFFHAHPDNGTFELWVKGRNFTPDAGSSVYGDDPKTKDKKDWFRSTKAHQTLTLDDKNMVITKASQNKWKTGNDLDVLTYTNPSYENLNHQRTVLFIDKIWFLVIDRAIGKATGNLGIHFVWREDSKPVFDQNKNRVNTSYADGNNLLIQCLSPNKSKLKEEESFVAYQYQKELKRPAFVFEKSKDEIKTQGFITILYPYNGKTPPQVKMTENPGHNLTEGKINITITINNTVKQLQQTL